jgi:GDP-L-fucose synthase
VSDFRAAQIFVAGHRGLAGSAIVRSLKRQNYAGILTATRDELDLRDQAATARFFAAHRPDCVILAAAKVGGIMANATRPADFLYDNLAIQTNVIHSAWVNNATRVVFLGSSCIYPKFAPQPIPESSLLTGPLEATNEAYAIAKISGLKLLQAYRTQHGLNGISLMPTNLYGPGDNFDLATSHVLPALIRRFHEACLNGAPEVVLWGTGTPRREFLHVDDLADAVVFALENYDKPEPLNVGVGNDVAIADLAALVAKITGYRGLVLFDSAHPDGTPRKLLDVSRINALGWSAKIALEAGIESTYQWFCRRPASVAV